MAGGTKARGPEPSEEPPAQRAGAVPPADPTGPGRPGRGDGVWGQLPPYLQFLRHRGSPPEIPERYRKYYEACLKAAARKKRTR